MLRGVVGRPFRSTSLHVPRLVATLIAGLACLSSFGSVDCRATVIDLAEDFANAETRRETRALDLAPNPSATLAPLGFYSNRSVEPDGLRWSEGERSVLELYFPSPASRRLTLRGHPFEYVDAPDQEVEFLLNGTLVGRTRMSRMPQEVSTSLPASVQRVGPNRLELRYADVRRPIDVVPGSLDRRSLAVAWEWLRVSTTDTRAREAPHSERRPSVKKRDRDGQSVITLPPESFLVHHARIVPGTTFEVASLHWANSATQAAPTREAVLRLIVETDEDGRIVEIEKNARGLSEPIAIPVEAERIARLVLAAGGGAARGTVEIAGAKLRIPDDGANAKVDTREVERPSAHGANVVLYVIDTLRSDFIGSHGRDAHVSPNFDRFAEQGIVFENALAVASWTRPAMASVLTGLYPNRHGVVGRKSMLSEEAGTLAELLQAAGYRTIAFNTNPNLFPQFGFRQGFAQFMPFPSYGLDKGRKIGRSSPRINRAASNWLKKFGSDRFFIYVHVTDPHSPYQPPPEERRRFASHVDDAEIGTEPHMKSLRDAEELVTKETADALKSLYLAEIAYADARLGEFLENLEKSGHAEDTIVIVMSDHGEEFMDHGRSEHGMTLYGEQLRVPLVIRLPGNGLAGRRVRTPVEQVDLMPTLLDLLGLPIPADLDGRSLLPILDAPAATRSAPTFASLDLEQREIESVTEGRLKLIETFAHPHEFIDYPSLQLFDLVNDPGELRDLSRDRPVAVGYLLMKIRAQQRRSERGLEAAEAEIDAELEGELRALGYIE